MKSTAGTPLSFFGFPSVAGISIQRTAVVFSSPIIITSQATASHLNKGVNVKNSKLLPLDEEQGLQINASDVTLLSVSIFTGIHHIEFSSFCNEKHCSELYFISFIAVNH